MACEQWPPLNIGNYFWVPIIIVIHRFDFISNNSGLNVAFTTTTTTAIRKTDSSRPTTPSSFSQPNLFSTQFSLILLSGQSYPLPCFFKTPQLVSIIEKNVQFLCDLPRFMLKSQYSKVGAFYRHSRPFITKVKTLSFFE